MESMQFEGSTVDEAIEQATQTLNVPKDQLEIEVISNGSTGFLGLLGSKKAQVQVNIRKDPKEAKKEQAETFLKEMLNLADIPATVTSSVTNNKIFLTMKGDGSGLLIGKRGQTLDSIQFVVNKVVNRDPTKRIPVIIDTENYRNRREAKLTSIAHRLGDRAKRKGTTVTTELLNPQERRVVYIALQDDPDIVAKSEGDGALKRVVIYPNKR
jgi:spoIIIJ-associated protein